MKAYYRRASANYALGKLKEALKDFKQVVKLKPKDEDAMKKMKTCEKEMKAEAFTKAIESEGGPNISSVMSMAEIAAIAVESSYDGPILAIRRSGDNSSSDGLDVEGSSTCDSPIAIEFIHEMIAHFKNQKLLHRKYVPIQTVASIFYFLFLFIHVLSSLYQSISASSNICIPITATFYEHCFPLRYVLQILLLAKDHFNKEPSLLRLRLPVQSKEDRESNTSIGATDGSSISFESDGDEVGHFTVCGDTHGQFYDLLNIFAKGGFPSETNPYLFNGDFVDRGSFSFETAFTLLAIKLACPKGLFMLRGNHETKNMNKIYGFEGEVHHKYDSTVMQHFAAVFRWLPLAAVISNNEGPNPLSVFVVHGGLSTNIASTDADSKGVGAVSLSTIEAVVRGREPPESGLMSDLLWSDPQPLNGRSLSKRGVGFSFGPDYTAAFLEKNNLQLLVRSHEVKDEGYVVEHDGKCITIFSAPNYCDQMGNKGAFIRFRNDMKPHFTQFESSPHPNIPPMRYAGNMFGL